jgi:outer membrane protein assembly factor BamB
VVRPGIADTTIWVAARDANAIAAYSLNTGALRQRISGCVLPGDFVLSHDGRTIFATCETGLGLRIIDVATGTTRAAFELEGGFGVALASDGRTLFAAGMGGTILVLDVATETVIRAYRAGGVPRRMTADGSSTAYVANEYGWVNRVTRD